MLKMMKYEFMRSRFVLAVIGILFALVQVYFVGAVSVKSEANVAISATLLMLSAFGFYIYVLISGLVCFEKDMKNKEGYLVFMTPLSSYKIVAAKLLYTLLLGVALVLVLAVAASLDYSFLAARYEIGSLIQLLDDILSSMGSSVKDIFLAICGFIIAFLLQFFMMVTLFYLAYTVSSCIIINTKVKGFVGGVLFVALYAGVTALAMNLPNVRTVIIGQNITFLEVLFYVWPQLLVYFITIVISYIGTSVLLDKKINL